MRVLVTGANGFVGSWLIPRLVADGHEVVAAVGPSGCKEARFDAVAEVLHLDVTDDAAVKQVAEAGPEVVVHLAGFSSGAESAVRTVRAYEINTVGTARLAEALGARVASGGAVRMILASSGLVYGSREAPVVESDPVRPEGSYAGSKAAAEVAVLETARRTGLEVVVARAFPHTGPRQDGRFVVPGFVRRVIDADRAGAAVVTVGNLEPIRDFLHVIDVVDAYVALMERGRPGEVYNIASGKGTSIGDLFRIVAEVVGSRVIPEVDATLVRSGDTMCSIGNATKITGETGWRPTRSLEETVQEVVDAQTN